MSDDYNNDNDYWDDDYFERHRDDYSTGGSGSGDCGNGPGAMFLIGIAILLLGGPIRNINNACIFYYVLCLGMG